MLKLRLEEEEEDLPFDMPDLPQYSSRVDNVLSLVGRVLNPAKQKVTSLILDLPRKWQKVGRVRGVALSKERFQFIFNSEHDLVEILEKGLHTYNEWAIALERWVEVPPADYLQFVPIWVRIIQIPMNHNTAATITALGKLVGRVVEVSFDPTKPQARDYERVLISFDVSRSLRRSKVVNLPEGGTAMVLYDYEKVQKRCFTCQRLTHDKEICPLFLRKDKEMRETRGNTRSSSVIGKDDPLFGVLSDKQVGFDPLTGRPKIAEDVLQGIRGYLMTNSGEAQFVKETRVKQTVADAEKDPITRKTILRLEPAPIYSAKLDKGKGLVFEYDSSASTKIMQTTSSPNSKLMSDAIEAGEAMIWNPAPMHTSSQTTPWSPSPSPFMAGPTANRDGLNETVSSGTLTKKGKPRKRPYKSNRKPRGLEKASTALTLEKKQGSSVGYGEKKRKATEAVHRPATCSKHEVVPNEGPSTI